MGEEEDCQPEVDKRVSESSLDDLANILYTSGTQVIQRG